MASYSVFLKRPAAKQLEGIGLEADRRRIADRIRALAQDPRPVGSERLAGRQDRLRIRQGDTRIIYSVDDARGAITIVRIAHRSLDRLIAGITKDSIHAETDTSPPLGKETW